MGVRSTSLDVTLSFEGVRNSKLSIARVDFGLFFFGSTKLDMMLSLGLINQKIIIDATNRQG